MRRIGLCSSVSAARYLAPSASTAATAVAGVQAVAPWISPTTNHSVAQSIDTMMISKRFKSKKKKKNSSGNGQQGGGGGGVQQQQQKQQQQKHQHKNHQHQKQQQHKKKKKHHHRGNNKQHGNHHRGNNNQNGNSKNNMKNNQNASSTLQQQTQPEAHREVLEKQLLAAEEEVQRLKAEVGKEMKRTDLPATTLASASQSEATLTGSVTPGADLFFVAQEDQKPSGEPAGPTKAPTKADGPNLTLSSIAGTVAMATIVGEVIKIESGDACVMRIRTGPNTGSDLFDTDVVVNDERFQKYCKQHCKPGAIVHVLGNLQSVGDGKNVKVVCGEIGTNVSVLYNVVDMPANNEKKESQEEVNDMDIDSDDLFTS